MPTSKRPEGERVAFTPEQDRRIFEGYLGDRKAMIAELGQDGISERAIVKRGEELGLSKSFLSKCEAGGVKLSVRECLSCGAAFVSIGPQNRMCKRCRHRP